MDLLAEKKIALCFWDRSDRINNEFVARRCKQLTLFYKNAAVPQSPMLINQDVDVLLNTAADLGCKYAIVQSFGHLTLRRKFFELLIDYLDKNDLFLMGHILDYQQNYFELHHQCFVVNLDYFRAFKRPAYGRPVSSGQFMHPFRRSAENFHDHYTPYWVEPDKGEFKLFKPTHEGWNIIAASIENGMRVHNFDHAIRAYKNFLYPEASTANFEKALKDPYCQGLDLNICQANYLKGMSYNWDAGKKSIFIYNTEAIGYSHKKTADGKKLDALFAVAAGFKPLKILMDNGFHDETEIIYFDYSPNALNFKKLLHENWDGENYVEFLKANHKEYLYGHYQSVPRNNQASLTGDQAFADIPHDPPDYSKLENLWNKTLEEFGGQENFRNIWQASRKLKHTFIESNILGTPRDFIKMIGKFENKQLALFWSNSFNVETAYCYLDESIIEEGFKNWMFILKNSPNELHLYGTTPKGLDLQHLPKNYYKDIL